MPIIMPSGSSAAFPGRSIYDNTRTAIDKVGRGKERDVNVRFMAMAGHYMFEPEFCNPVSGWEKGQVEKNIQDTRHRFYQPIPRFPSLDALNDWLELRCKAFWAKPRTAKCAAPSPTSGLRRPWH